MPKPGNAAAIAVFAGLALAQVACASGRPAQAPPAGKPVQPPSSERGVAEASDERDALARLAEIAAERRLVAGFLVVDGVYNTELTAPYDVLQHSVHHAGEGLGIEVFTVSPDGGPVTTAEGLRLQADHGFDDAPALDILVVPSAEGSRDRDLERNDLIEWTARTGRDAAAVMSLCWGAFVLAEAGLLDGRSCTTFPSDYDSFSERYRKLDLRINVSFVHSGKVITSQGGARSFDAAMYLVDQLYGEAVAKGVGGGLLIAWPPAAGTTPYLVTEPR